MPEIFSSGKQRWRGRVSRLSRIALLRDVLVAGDPGANFLSGRGTLVVRYSLANAFRTDLCRPHGTEAVIADYRFRRDRWPRQQVRRHAGQDFPRAQR